MLASPHNRLRVAIAIGAAFQSMIRPTDALAGAIACPDPPAQYAKDVNTDTQVAIGALGRLKASELANKTQVVTKPLLDNVPNSDRFYLTQSLISTFCRMISASSLTDNEKLDRLTAFTDQIMSPYLGGNTRPRLSAADPSSRPVIPPKQNKDLEKYIDTSARRSADRKNIAVSVLEYAGANVDALEGAARRTLSDRGYNVMPLFRADFTRDEIGRTLFSGNAAVANRLELRKHVDTVLLGRLRLVGPVSNVNGLFISEWELDLRAISPETGSVTDERQIVEKGGGPSPDSSRAAALRQIEENLALQLAEWSWT